MILFYHRRPLVSLFTEKLSQTLISLIFGLISGILYVFGWLLQYQNNIGDSLFSWIKAFLIAMALVPIPMSLFALIYNRTINVKNKQNGSKFLFSVVKEDGYNRNTTIIYWVVFFVSYLPAFLAYYPGLLVYDAQYQFNQIHNGFMTTHHPIIHMVLMKAAYRIGSHFSSMNEGFAIITILQMLILSFAFANAIGFLQEIRISRKCRIIITVILILFPMHAVYAVSITKDVLFAAFFLMFTIESLRIYIRHNISVKRIVFYVIVTIMMLLFRNNAIYAFALSIPFVLWIQKNNRVKLIIAITISIVGFITINQGLIKIEGALDNSSTKEKLSLPIQQIARVYDYKEEARADMQEVVQYIPEDLLLNYDPYISDGIKNHIDNDLLKINMKNFMKNWAKMAVKYPGEYVEALLTNTMGFWYLDDTMHARIYGEGGYIIVSYSSEAFYDLVSPTCFIPPMKDYYDAWFLHNGYQKIPLISILFRPAVYFMTLFIGVLIIIYKKAYRLLLPYIPIICYAMTLLLAPTAIVRYVYCIIAVIPFVIIWTISEIRKIEVKTNTAV